MAEDGTLDTPEKRHRAMNACLRPAQAPLFPYPYTGQSAVERTHTAGFYTIVVTPKEYAVYYAIELELNENHITDESVGLKEGVFRWITGTPDFDGSSDGAKMEDGSPNTRKWYEGVLMKDSMSNPSRKIDIKDSGDYATLNGFRFSIRNDEFFWERLSEKKIYIANSTIKVYAVLDKTFYSVWQGVVKSTSYTETDYTFNCETNFKTLHKPFPSEIVTEMTFPDVKNISKNAIGQVIPVCLGDVPYAKGLNVSGEPEVVAFPKKLGGGCCSIFAASEYTPYATYSPPVFHIALKTSNVEIEDVAINMIGKYLHVLNGNGDDYYRIVHYHKDRWGDEDFTIFGIDRELKGWENKFIYPPYRGESALNSNDYKNVWFFRILEEPPIRYIVSQRAVSLINYTNHAGDIINYHKFFNYKNEYRSVDFAVRGYNFDNESEYSNFFTIPEKAAAAKYEVETGVRLNSAAAIDSILVNGQINDNESINFSDAKTEVRLSIPNNLDFKDGRLYLAVDMDCVSFFDNWQFTVEAFAIDSYNNPYGPNLLFNDDKEFLIDMIRPVRYHNMNLISNTYYDRRQPLQPAAPPDKYSTEDAISLWPEASFVSGRFNFRELTTLDRTKFRAIFSNPNTYAQDRIRLEITVRPSAPDAKISGASIFIKEACFSTFRINPNEDENNIDIENENLRRWFRPSNVRDMTVTPNQNRPTYYDLRRQRMPDTYLPSLEYKRNNITGNNPLKIELDVYFPSGSTDFDRLKNSSNKDLANLCFDLDVACHSNTGEGWEISCEAFRIFSNGSVDRGDSNGNDLFRKRDNENLSFTNFIIGSFPSQNCAYNFLPNVYYSESQELARNPLWPLAFGDMDNRFQKVFDIKSMAVLNNEVLKLMEKGILNKEICVKVKIEEKRCSYTKDNFNICNKKLYINNSRITQYDHLCPHSKCLYENTPLPQIRLKQVGLVKVTQHAFVEDGVYVRDIKGESSNGISSDSVYGAFYNILNKYDEIESADIDFRNLPLTRDAETWRVGRQILQQKNSFDYLKELCKQSFVGMAPSRNGKLILNAWRNQGDPYSNSAPCFDGDTIIRDSIMNFAYTEPQNLYNDFRINYMYNPGRGTFDRCLVVTKAWEAAFPSNNTNYRQYDWISYVGGIFFNPLNLNSRRDAYYLSRSLWRYCKEGFRFAGKTQRVPDNLANLHWCVDFNHALNYLTELIRWTAVPKAQVEFSVPLNGYIRTTNGHDTRRNITLELMDQVLFKDLIYTKDQYLTGYITKIETNTKKSEMKLEVIFEPEDYSDLIIERGIPLNDSYPQIVEGENTMGRTVVEGGYFG